MRILFSTLLLAGVMQPALAQDSAAPEVKVARTLALPPLPFLDTVAGEPDAMGPGADSGLLATTRGREGGSANADLGGMVTGNSAINVSTGSNLITDGSFANMSGLPVVIQNTGANVLIQNATVINLQLR